MVKVFYKKVKYVTLLLNLSFCLFTGCQKTFSNKKRDALLSQEDPVTIRVWNYYSGKQKAAFDALTAEFNDTVGFEKGIVIEIENLGSIDAICKNLIASAQGTIGSEKLPDLVSIYPDTVYTLYKMDALTNLLEYFTQKELSEYLPGYIEEGIINDGLFNFPIGKSTEIFLYNKTDWEHFIKAGGTSAENINSIEDLVATAKKYYEWTDSFTPNIKNDGKALFGRDAIDNYMITGLKQLGHPAFFISNGKVIMDLDKESLKKLWNCYYIPFINGWFASYGKFSSDDAKTGKILSYIGSSGGAGFFPTEIVLDDDKKHPIEVGVRSVPFFSDATTKSIVQQGAGYSIIKSDKKHQYAATIFLKWLTSIEKNIELSVKSGYLPVKIESLQSKNLDTALLAVNANSAIKQTLIISRDALLKDKSYALPPFDDATTARYALRDAMTKQCNKDRAIVLERLSQGKSMDEAVSDLASEDAFNAWYDMLTQKMTDIFLKDKTNPHELK